MEGLGRALRREGERVGMTSGALARKLGVVASYVCNVEAGFPVSPDTVRRVAEALGLDGAATLDLLVLGRQEHRCRCGWCREDFAARAPADPGRR